MPWEKSFNEELALEKAMTVFWEVGYEPASIANLLKDMELNRGSFYNTFGSKQELFEKALVKYDQDYRQPILAQLEALNNPRQAIDNFFEIIVNRTIEDQQHKGCFLFNTAAVISTHNEKVNEIVSNAVREIEGFFRRCIEVGQARHEIPTNLQPEATAKVLLSLIISIRILGRGIFEEAALFTIANQGKHMVRP